MMKNFTFGYRYRTIDEPICLRIPGLAIKPEKFQGAACSVFVQVGIAH
jgi:hypothetical protein